MSARTVLQLKLLAAAAGVGALLAVVIAVAAFQGLYRARVYPGVHVQGIGTPLELGGQTRDEAIVTLVGHYDRFLSTPLLVRYLGKEWRTTPRDLGARVDVEASVDAALALGRQGSTWTRLREETLGLRRAITVDPPPVTLDDEKLTGFIAKLAGDVERSPTSADLALKPEGGVTVLASQTGRRLSVARTAEQWKGALTSFSTQPLTLAVDDVPPALAEADLAAVKRDAEKIIGAPLVLRADLPEGARSWTLGRQELVDLLELKTTSGRPPRYELRIDEARIRQYIEKIAPEIERPSRNARFALDNGALTVIRESEEGRRVEITASINLIRSALTSDERQVTLPWQPMRPAFASADVGRLAFPEVIERASTAYGGTLPERMFNVELASQRINGVVIGPGDSFSFNEEVGEVSYRSGYKKGYGISQDGDDVVTIPSEGGGICQVATTLFQSVFWAGYPIVERNWHLYWIPRYGQRPRGLKGLDATIDQVYDAEGKLLYAVDLRWRNNTEAPILLVAETNGKDATVALWGRKPLWQVKVAEPKIDKMVKADTRPVRQPDTSLPNGSELMVEHAEDGFQSTIVRSTFLDGKLIDETRLVSTYRPSRNVFLVGGAPRGAPAAVRVEDRPATPASVPTPPQSVVTPYAPPDTPTPAAPRATVTPAPPRPPTPRSSPSALPIATPSPPGRG